MTVFHSWLLELSQKEDKIEWDKIDKIIKRMPSSSWTGEERDVRAERDKESTCRGSTSSHEQEY